MHWWVLSVLSVCPVHDPKSRAEGHRKMKIGRKEAHDSGDPWPHLEVERPKVEVISPIRPGDHQAQNPQSTISHVFGTGKPTNFKLGIWMEYDDPHHRHARWPTSWKVWVVVQVTTCQGAGAYCGSLTTGCTAWSIWKRVNGPFPAEFNRMLLPSVQSFDAVSWATGSIFDL